MSEQVASAEAVSTSQHRYHRSFNQLLHLTSLARSGQGRAALERLVLVVLHVGAGAEPSRGMTVSEIVEALDYLFGVRRTADEVRSELDHHTRAFNVRKVTAGGYALTPAEAERIEARVEAAHGLEREIRQEWLEELENHGLRGEVAEESLWTALQGYVTRVFQRHGALSVELLDPESTTSADDADLEGLLEEAITEAGLAGSHDGVEDAVTCFFRSKTPSRSKYLSELLDGTFTFFALQSNEALEAYVGDLKPLSLFLDTNVILSLLGADDDQSHELARELVDFIQSNELPCTLYYHESTLREVERTLEAVGRHLCSRDWSPSTSAAALKTRTGSGIELRYHALNAEQRISPRAFVDRFSNVKQLLDDLGVSIYRPSTSAEKDLEEISTLIADYGAFVRSSRPEDKPYDALDHDVRVWLSVRERRRRAGGGSTALDAGALLVSNDRLFRNFTRRKLAGDRVPSVVLPEQLLQVLRPFGSTDDDWAARFIETFAVPEFRTAASDYGEAAGKLLEYIALYRDLPEPTAVKLLTDQLLLDELSELRTDGEFAAAVEESLAEEIRELGDALDAKDEQHREALDELERTDARNRELETQVQELSGADGDRDEALQQEQRRRADAEAKEHALAQRIERLEAFGKTVVALLVTVAASAGLLLAPRMGGWAWMLEHDNWLSLQVLGVLGAAALGASVWWPKSGLAFFGTIVVASVTLL